MEAKGKDTNTNLGLEIENGENSKSLYLIRHSESINNYDLQESYNGLLSLGQFRLPSFGSVQSTFALLAIRMDTDLSSQGKEMVRIQRKRINGPLFLMEHNVELVLHSHLIRAKRSCYGLFADDDMLQNFDKEGDLETLDEVRLVDDSINTEDVEEGQQEKRTSIRNIPVIEHDSLYEKNLQEYFDIFMIHRRIDAIKSWLLKRKEKRIVIVGHSIFFQLFLQSPTKMKNCEISQVILNEDGSCTNFEILFPGGLSLLEHRDSNEENNDEVG